MIQFPGQITARALNATFQIAWNPAWPPYYIRAFFSAIRRTYGLFAVDVA